MDRSAVAITRTDAAQALESAATDRVPIFVNRFMAYGRACYGWAIKANLMGSSPFAKLAAPGRARPRDRILSVAEVRAIWAATAALNPWHRAFVRILLLYPPAAGGSGRVDLGGGGR